MNRAKVTMPGWAVAEEAALKMLRGEERLARTWKVVERLGESGEIDAKIEWLKKMMRASWKEARLDYKLRAFTELRRIYAVDGRYADLRKDVLWYYKWLVEELPEHADVPLETLVGIFSEMEAFYQEQGVCLRPVYSLRCRAAILMGNRDEADTWYEKWRSEPAGESDDCAACEADRKILYLLECEKSEAALAAAEPIFRGKIFCEDTPVTLTRLVGSAFRLKRMKLARALLRMSGKPARRVRGMLSSLAAQVVFQLITGNPVRARRLALLALRRVKDSINDLDRYNVYRGCGLWAALSLVVGMMGQRVPRRLMPGAEPKTEGTVELAEVAGLCLAEAGRIAARLDGRNRTSRYVDRLDELESAIRKAVSAKSLMQR